MNETAFQLALLSATIAGPHRDPLAHIEQARELLRACQTPATAPVEPSRRLPLDEALCLVFSDSNPSRRRDKLRKFLQDEAAQMRVTCGDKPNPRADLRNAQVIFEEYERDGIPRGVVEKLMKPKPQKQKR